MVSLFVFLSVAAMTAARLLLKKGLLIVGESPGRLGDLLPFLLKAHTNAYVASAVLLAILTAMAWMLAVARAELGQIYPCMALSYVLVALLSSLMLERGYHRPAMGGNPAVLRRRVSGGQESGDIEAPDYRF